MGTRTVYVEFTDGETRGVTGTPDEVNEALLGWQRRAGKEVLRFLDKEGTDLGSKPWPFTGSSEEIRANHATHSFSGEPGDERCVRCDSRPSYEAADYPCGANVPRIPWAEESS